MQYVGIILIATIGPVFCGLFVDHIAKLYNKILLYIKAKRFKKRVKKMEEEINQERELNNIEVEVKGKIIE